MDHISRRKRSEIMGKIPSSGNRTTEKKLIAIMRRFGIKGWRTKSCIFGKPDFYFPESRVVVFVDGDFWHGHAVNFRLPSSNSDYWSSKIKANKDRDRKVNAVLRQQGYTVVRFWESSLKEEHAIASRLSKFLSPNERNGSACQKYAQPE
jgi:DNA mismatch endonuclease (patch repair protein)